MNRPLPLIPSHHAALPPAPPSSRHVVGVKAWGVREKLGPKSATIHPLRRSVSPPLYSRLVKMFVIRASMRALSPYRPREGVICSISCDWRGCFPFCCLPPSSRCVGLPYPDSSRAFVSIGVSVVCYVVSTAGRWRLPGCLFITKRLLTLMNAERSPCLTTGVTRGRVIVVDTGIGHSIADLRLTRVDAGS